MGSAPIKVALKVKMAASSRPCFARLLSMDCPRKGVAEGGEALSSRGRTEILTMEEVCWLSSLRKRASPFSFLEGPSASTSLYLPQDYGRWEEHLPWKQMKHRKKNPRKKRRDLFSGNGSKGVHG